jgi:putative spermidine/putrescine transport system permease protein
MKLREPLMLWLPLAPALLVVAVLFGAGVVYGVSQSLGYLPIIGQTTVSLVAYERILLPPSPIATEFWNSLAFSIWVSSAATLLAAGGALGVAVLLTGERETSTISVFLLHLNLALPHLVWAIALSLLLAQSGVLARIATAFGWITTPIEFPVLVRDRYGIGIILDYVTKEIPFLTLILLAVLRSQPRTYHVVAENLGASAWQRLRYITFPLVRPGLMAGSLLVFAFIFGAYEVPALLGVRYPRMIAALALDFFLNPELQRRAEGMAISVIMALVVVAVAVGGYWLNERQSR